MVQLGPGDGSIILTWPNINDKHLGGLFNLFISVLLKSKMYNQIIKKIEKPIILTTILGALMCIVQSNMSFRLLSINYLAPRAKYIK